jgi:hypothetical protein
MFQLLNLAGMLLDSGQKVTPESDLIQRYLDGKLTRVGAVYLAMVRAAPLIAEDGETVEEIVGMLAKGCDVILLKGLAEQYVNHGAWLIDGSYWEISCEVIGVGQTCVLRAREVV